MFSGIVEVCSPAVKVRERSGLIELQIKRPNDFSDLKVGDSIAVNGVCLTLEAFDEASMQFALAAETLQVTKWTLEILKTALFNIERSLAFGDRIHGHLVSGHVDSMARVREVVDLGESRIMAFERAGEVLASLVWKKGAITVNGVSLTVNEVDDLSFRVCVIPETLKRTNLGFLKVGDLVTLEADYMARATWHWLEGRKNCN